MSNLSLLKLSVENHLRKIAEPPAPPLPSEVVTTAKQLAASQDALAENAGVLVRPNPRPAEEPSTTRRGMRAAQKAWAAKVRAAKARAAQLLREAKASEEKAEAVAALGLQTRSFRKAQKCLAKAEALVKDAEVLREAAKAEAASVDNAPRDKAARARARAFTARLAYARRALKAEAKANKAEAGAKVSRAPKAPAKTFPVVVTFVAEGLQPVQLTLTLTAYKKAVKKGLLPRVVYKTTRRRRSTRTPGAGCYLGPLGTAPKYGRKGRKTGRKGCRVKVQ